jgi:thiol peroxidase
MTLAGNALAIGAPIPDFTVHYFEGGLKAISRGDLAGKPTILSVVPSLDTTVCQIQTKKFNAALAAMGDQIHAVTISRDLPFAMNRFCGAEEIKSMRVGSDYQAGDFGLKTGLMLDELKLLARAVIVLDATGKVVYEEIVPEVTSEPNYEKAIAALRGLVS